VLGGPSAKTNPAETSPAGTTGGYSISGTVTGPGGTPLANIEVDANSSGYWNYDLTASDGTYSVDVPSGTYTVSFYDGSGTYLSGYYSSGGFVLDQGSATPVPVSSSDVTGINVQLGIGHYVKGTVAGPGGTPLEGIRVRVYSSSYYGYSWTASDGTYSVAVPSGTYTVSFYDPNGTYLSGYYSSGGFVLDQGSATPVPVSSSDVTGINVQMPLPVHIKGTVTGPGGAPLANIEVDADSSSYYGYSWTASDGTYTVAVAPAGSYTMSFYDPNGTYLSGYYSSGGFTLDYSSATPVPVSTSDVSGINVQMPLAVHIEGTVTGPGGTPLEGIRVRVYSSSYYGYSWTASDVT
jgi:protocatechuate 3,4-dioxygenase beta subunit